MRNSLLQMIGLLAASGLIVTGGIVHGLMTNRWERQDESMAIAKRFDSFPQQIGEWELKETEEMSPQVVKMLQCDGYLVRNYLNANTGESVKVAVTLGPTGPTSVHTPEICYSSREYSIEEARQAEEFIAADHGSDALWKLTLRAHDLEAHRLRIYYGWTTDGKWQADANPRFSFAGEPFLAKIQIAGRISLAHDASLSDPCLRFLKEFTPQLRKHLFAAK